jgi:branched-chain amino acid transport system substrate-binding protein
MKQAAALLVVSLLAPMLARSAPPLPKEAPNKTEILLGQSAPLSGPSAQLGLDYREGALAWFRDVNRRGGIHGRKLRLISLDDRYEPPLTVRNTEQLIERDKVFALFGYVGTPTTKEILPLVEQQNIPLIAPLSGARLLREPQRPMVFNLRASYHAEIQRMVNALVRAGLHQIAVVHQLDAFGEDGLEGSRQALKHHGLEPVAIAGVQRNSTSTDRAARHIHSADPDAVLIISSYPGSASFSKHLRALGSHAQLMNVSFVDTSGLQDALPGGQATGIGIAQVVPFPWDRRIPVVRQYQQLMQRQQTSVRYGFTSLEGFLAARLMTAALEKAGPSANRQELMASLEALSTLDLGGFTLKLGPKDHQASDLVELTFLGSQRWGP